MPDHSFVLGANSFGKEVVGVKHKNKRARDGCFLLYTFTDTYTFKQTIVNEAVNACSFIFNKQMSIVNVTSA